MSLQVAEAHEARNDRAKTPSARHDRLCLIGAVTLLPRRQRIGWLSVEWLPAYAPDSNPVESMCTRKGPSEGKPSPSEDYPLNSANGRPYRLSAMPPKRRTLAIWFDPRPDVKSTHPSMCHGVEGAASNQRTRWAIVAHTVFVNLDDDGDHAGSVSQARQESN